MYKSQHHYQCAFLQNCTCSVACADVKNNINHTSCNMRRRTKSKPPSSFEFTKLLSKVTSRVGTGPQCSPGADRGPGAGEEDPHCLSSRVGTGPQCSPGADHGPGAGEEDPHCLTSRVGTGPQCSPGADHGPGAGPDDPTSRMYRFSLQLTQTLSKQYRTLIK